MTVRYDCQIFNCVFVAAFKTVISSHTQCPGHISINRIIFIIKNKKKKKSNYDDCEELSDDYSLFEIKNNEQTIKNTNNNDNIN